VTWHGTLAFSGGEILDGGHEVEYFNPIDIPLCINITPLGQRYRQAHGGFDEAKILYWLCRHDKERLAKTQMPASPPTDPHW
jgi:hypothetical protein